MKAKKFGNGYMPDFSHDEIIPEIVVFNGPVNGSKTIEHNGAKLNITCSGM